MSNNGKQIPEEVTIKRIRELAREIAIKVKKSNFNPDVVVGIEIGGQLLGRLIAHELKVPLETVIVRRKTTSLMRTTIMRKIAKTRGGKTIGKFVNMFSNLGERHVKRTFEGNVQEQQKILIVDDGTNTGKTMETTIKILLQKGGLRENIKTACVNAEGKKYKPNFYLTTKAIWWPWSTFSKYYPQFRKWRAKYRIKKLRLTRK